MTLLAIDVGNTNTVFALFQEEKLTHSWRCKTDAARSIDEYAVFLNQLFELHEIKWDYIENTVISSVVPDTNFHLERLCEKYIGSKPLFVTAQTAQIDIALPNPSEAGADRLANTAAVLSEYKAPAIVIDFGTATTFDVIKDNIYCGGVIAPGIKLSVQALTDRAAKLPQISIAQPEHAIGHDTRSAMQSGIYWGYVGMVEKILDKIMLEMNVQPYIIATGGLAELYAQNIQIDCVDEHLILKGLLEIHKRNKQ